MRKTLGTLMLLVVSATALGGCSSLFGRAALNSRAAASEELFAAAPNPDLVAGRQALSEGQLGAAIAALRLARLDPASTAEATNGLGVAYAQLGRDDLADRYFHQAAALAPQDPRFAANLERFNQSRAARLAHAPPAPAAPAPAEQVLKAGIRGAVGGTSKAVTVSSRPAAPRVTVSVQTLASLVQVSPGRSQINPAGPVQVGKPARVAMLSIPWTLPAARSAPGQAVPRRWPPVSRASPYISHYE
ncbi:MAG: hypothetical protein RL339_2121 [Pseudomonadota bacterium]